MKAPSIGLLSAGAIGLLVLALLVIGPPGTQVAPPAPGPSEPAPSSISVAGFKLTSASIDMPLDDQQYPDGPNADIVNANCTSCHSASMALTQPVLTADQWKATVIKMKDVYKAPVADRDIPAIVAYLTATSADKTPPADAGGDSAPAAGTGGETSGSTG